MVLDVYFTVSLSLGCTVRVETKREGRRVRKRRAGRGLCQAVVRELRCLSVCE